MNDQHPYAGYVGDDSHSTGSFDNDPLFGSLPGSYDGTYDTAGYHSGYDAGQAGYNGPYDSSQWDAGVQQTVSYDAYAAYGTEQPQYDTTATWMPDAAGIPAQAGAPDTSGQWDTADWHQNGQWATAAYDTGAYDATAWNTGATPDHEQHAAHTVHGMQESYVPEQSAHEVYEAHEPYESYGDQGSYDPYRTAEFSVTDTGPDTADRDADTGGDTDSDDGAHPQADDAPDMDQATDRTAADIPRPATRPSTRGGSRSRRRTPAKRSALLTVAVPSACVMSVAGIAAASVSGLGSGEDKADDTLSMAAADPGTVKPVAANNKLDTQLANLSADAENFADRASRTQERIDLKERQAAEKKKREEEAARKEALRPKFLLPITQHGLSAYFGQAGVNWMSVHTGIDFPVSYGTPVMAATDGTIRTQWNNAYGNMAIVTMADGTETWYCHLSSTKLRSGPVKAGDVIAYSGNSGNSTGPHMHFEVRPGGGAAIDPLPWLRSHGLDPT
ncbi:peptidoglycan DD-metalloendopeptidase family protein [Streptomyces sp. JH14]|uniref:M23 family metallopeptidase n=1 Tax=Streptomyces sp. JH14 TaxID=2793630 RepID=UPI0023F8BA24|nr:M23 family metallopeptidase [Streptomyces sp. JH14]MDF6044365.1 peptidoglycan DD-metalloendopeptidase family protein [Streptomyces sp. JH14]